MSDGNENNGPALPDDEAKRISRRKTLFSFLKFGLIAGAGLGAYEWVTSRPEEDGIPWPMRRVLRFNEKVSGAFFRDGSRMDERAAGTAPANPRLNSHIGIDENISATDYRLNLIGTAGAEFKTALTLDDLKALPKVLQTTRLCCVEGWSTWGNWAGARLMDLVAKYAPAERAPYVALSTASGEYYVGLDRASAFHPQTLLVYELDGQSLSIEHGFPVRLVIPTKYGIKNIKQVARIEFTQTRPPDYWAERGYDWYAGL